MLEINPSKIKTTTVVKNQKSEWVWDSVVPKNAGIYWLFSNIKFEAILADDFQYRDFCTKTLIFRNGIPANFRSNAFYSYKSGRKKIIQIEQGNIKGWDKAGGHCFKSRLQNNLILGEALSKPTCKEDLFCIYNGYVNFNPNKPRSSLQQRSKEHLRSTSPRTGGVKIIDDFCYKEKLVNNYKFEFRYYLLEDLPLAKPKQTVEENKRILAFYEQQQRVKSWPFLCLA